MQTNRPTAAGVIDMLPIVDPSGFSTDGFHASEIGYHAWAEHLYPFVMEETAAEREATLS